MTMPLSSPSTTDSHSPIDAPQQVAAAEPAGPLLVATDGSPSAEPAFVAARLLSERRRRRVEVVTLFEPVPIHLPPAALLAFPVDFDPGAMDRVLAQAREQARRTGGAAPGWPVRVYVGNPVPTMRQVARERSGSLVITGIGHHGIVDRVLGNESAPQLANLTPVPMLAVANGFDALPRTIVIAIDLDSAPLPDVPALQELMAQATTIHFVNVKPRVSAIERRGIPLGSTHTTTRSSMLTSGSRNRERFPPVLTASSFRLPDRRPGKSCASPSM